MTAFDASTGLLKSGDAANITVYVSKDGGTVTALTDTSATEMDATNAKGNYKFDVSQAETDAVVLDFTGKSSTANVVIVPVKIKTEPNYFSSMSIDSSGRVDVGKVGGTAQTARDLGASVLLSSGTGTGQISLSSGAVLLQATQTGVTIPTVTDVTNNLAKYPHGAVWVDTVNGAAGTTNYTNGIVSNPCSTIASAKTIADSLKMKRFWIQSGSSVTLGADYPGYVFTGAGYALNLSTRNVSGALIERSENLTGSGATCATGEAMIYECHVGALSIGEADFHRCHLNGTVTMSQASVPYLFNSCIGAASPKITFAAAGQSAVVSNFGGPLTVAGMVSGNTLYIDGDCDLTLDNTNSGGTVVINGNIRLTNLGASTITDTSRYSEDQNVTNVTGSVTGSVGSVTGNVGGNVTGSVGSVVGDTKQTGDAFARLGAPAGASVSADIATVALSSSTSENVLSDPDFGLVAVKTQTAAISAKTINLPSDPADQSAVESAITAATSPLATSTALTAIDSKIDTIDTIVDSILADTGTDGVVVAAGSKTGYELSSTGVDAIIDEVVIGSFTLRQLVRGIAYACLCKSDGAGTDTFTIRNLADTADAITATVDGTGNRLNVVLDLSA